MFLGAAMINLAVLYVAQDALFLGVVQIVVYTGAVMMLFLFVLMLIGVDSADSLIETLRGQRVAAALTGLGGFGILLIAGIGSVATSGVTGLAEANAGGNVQGLATLIFTRDLWAFELTSALLITAALGAMVLAHRERFERRKTQRELVIERFQTGRAPPPATQPGCVRIAQCRQHPGATAGRKRLRALGEPNSHPRWHRLVSARYARSRE